jgi:hypothetical protein
VSDVRAEEPVGPCDECYHRRTARATP